MITIQFAPIEALPNEPIKPLGKVSDAFLDRKVTTLHQAAHFVNQMPYGSNSSTDDALILFTEGFGTCLAKHGIIARLAREHGLPISRIEGFYPLTDKVVTGVDSILAEYGVPFIPRTHCFLRYQRIYVDLTDGNCTGKNGLIEGYLKLIDVEPEQTQAEEDRMYREFYSDLCAADPQFARLGVEVMLEILQRCRAVNTATCQIQQKPGSKMIDTNLQEI